MRCFLQPLLLAIYPVTFLYSRYAERVSAADIAVALFASLVIGLAVIFIVRFYFAHGSADSSRVQLRSTLGATLSILLIVSFGHVFNELYKWLFNLQISMNILNIQEWLVKVLLQLLLVGACLLILRSAFRRIQKLTDKTAETLTSIALVFSLTLLVMPIADIFIKSLTGEPITASVENTDSQRQEQSQPVQQSSDCQYCDSDIYHIVLDGYARRDVLNPFGFDDGIHLRVGKTAVVAPNGNHLVLRHIRTGEWLALLQVIGAPRWAEGDEMIRLGFRVEPEVTIQGIPLGILVKTRHDLPNRFQWCIDDWKQSRRRVGVEKS